MQNKEINDLVRPKSDGKENSIEYTAFPGH